MGKKHLVRVGEFATYISSSCSLCDSVNPKESGVRVAGIEGGNLKRNKSSLRSSCQGKRGTLAKVVRRVPS